MFFHRLVPSFVVQGGGFYTALLGTTNENIAFIQPGPPITNEFGVGTFYSNTNGTIAMAKTSDPNSATSEFFFNLTNNAASLDSTANSGGFTVFGHTVAGLSVLNVFNTFTTSPNATKNVIYDLSGPTSLDDPNFATTPMLDNSLTFEALVYVDITLLNVQVTNKNGLSKISWNSVSNQANVVEYTTKFPPVWNTVTNVLGKGSATNVVDPTSLNANRFYRVRVAY
jgi:cyclophilin family peptidyl-prolyl cis-trans isomerase